MNKKYSIILLLLVLVFLVSCGGKEPAQDTSSPEPAAYPIQEGESSYPVSEPDSEPETGYPVEENETSYIQGPEFSFDIPVTKNDESVTGTGPAGVPIRLVDVSEVGLELSTTLINSDGTFEFTLEEPLISGHTIGIQIGDLENTDFSEGDFLYSDSYYERPMIGILFDMLVVE